MVRSGAVNPVHINGVLHRGHRSPAHRRRAGGPVRRILCRIPWPGHHGYRLAARAWRPDHHHVSGEVQLRRRRLPRGLRTRPGGRPYPAGGPVQPDVSARRDGYGARVRPGPPVVTTASGEVVQAKAVIITGGIGRFDPRPLPVGHGFAGRGLEYFVQDPAAYAGQDVVIVGGGDSALDWAQTLHPIANSVTLVHRRETFRAHEHTGRGCRRLHREGASHRDRGSARSPPPSTTRPCSSTRPSPCFPVTPRIPRRNRRGGRDAVSRDCHSYTNQTDRPRGIQLRHPCPRSRW